MPSIRNSARFMTLKLESLIFCKASLLFSSPAFFSICKFLISYGGNCFLCNNLLLTIYRIKCYFVNKFAIKMQTFVFWKNDTITSLITLIFS